MSLRGALAAEYLFNGNAQDSSGNGNHGQVIGAKPTADRFGNPNSAYAFDGKDDYVIVARPPALSAETLTISAWVRYNDGAFKGWNNAIVSQDDGDDFWRSYANHRRILQLGAKDRRITWHRMRGGGDDAKARSPFVTDTWYHIAAVVDGKTHRLYVNGMLNDSKESWFAASADEPLYIGRKAPPERRMFFNGAIDDVRIYNRALTAEEIQGLHDAGGWVSTAPPEYEPKPEALTWLGEAWTSLDIATGVPGRSVTDGDQLVIAAGGTGIKGREDNFRYVYQPIGGDFTATVTLTGMPHTSEWNVWAKAGIMLRGGFVPDAPHVMVFGASNEQISNVGRQVRLALGGDSPQIRDFGYKNHADAIRLKLVRQGDRVTAYAAKGDEDWTAIGEPITIQFDGGPVYVGLAVTPFAFGTLGEAGFRDWRLVRG